ncbi:eCIS core domain-containing protein [Kamptonema formosum]|uniref:eCIS core domain-containing protein n=1 Tax=Kamptonema formosum TaxID=331992 RepID=UPI00047754C2|nr:DUF4157 domain-containing protein [Oscillatoria sp. PCC 10802]
MQELQAAIGNRAVSRQIQAQRQSNPPAPIQAKPQFAGLSGSMAAFLPQSGTPIQAKLTLGAAGDRYEREADRIAAEVASRLNAPTTEVAGERHTAERQEVPAQQLQKKPVVSPLSAGEGGAVAPELEASIQGEKGSGHTLAKALREKMEQAFGGADFSGVRVHAGAESDRLNRSLNARAFTAGQEIFFRQGEYNPGSQEGRQLIAHELTHVVQQGGTSQLVQCELKPTKKEDLIQEFLKVGSAVGGTTTNVAKDLKTNNIGGSENAQLGLNIAGSAGNIVGGIGGLMDDIRNPKKDKLDVGIKGAKIGADTTKSVSGILESQNLYTESQVIGAVSDIAGGVIELVGMVKEATKFLEEIEKKSTGELASQTIKTSAQLMNATKLLRSDTYIKIKSALSGSKEQASKDAEILMESNVSSVMNDSVGLLNEVAKGVEAVAKLMKDIEAGKYKGELKTHRIIETVFESAATVNSISAKALGLSKTIATLAGNEGAKELLGHTTSVSGIVTGSLDIFRNTYKISRACLQKEELDRLALGRSEEEKKALMHIRERLVKRQANAGIEMVLGAAGIVSGGLTVSGVGAVPASIIAGIATGFKASRVGFKTFKQYMRDNAQSKYDETISALQEAANAANAIPPGWLGAERIAYYETLKQKIDNANGTNKKHLQAVLKYILQEEGAMLLTDQDIYSFIFNQEFDGLVDILKRVGSDLPAKPNKALGEDVQAYGKSLKKEIKNTKGKTKERLEFILDEQVYADKLLPIKDADICESIRQAELSRLAKKNLLESQFIFSRFKSTKQKDASYSLTAEEILKMDLNEVYSILNLKKEELEKVAEDARKKEKKKYEEDNQKLDSEELEGVMAIAATTAVRDLVIKQLKGLNT